jgi:hypothetical protein
MKRRSFFLFVNLLLKSVLRLFSLQLFRILYIIFLRCAAYNNGVLPHRALRTIQNVTDKKPPLFPYVGRI